MKFTNISAGHKLALLTSTVTLLGGLTAVAGSGLLAYESFDPPPTTDYVTWTGDTSGFIRQYVDQGTAGSMAVQLSVNMLANSGYAGAVLYQNDLILGSGRADTNNTVLSFDVKVDQPGLTHIWVVLEGCEGFVWNWFEGRPGVLDGSSGGYIALGDYTPGKFKHVVVPLNAPCWYWNSVNAPNPFSPNEKTYQIWVQINAGDFGLGPLTVTLDNFAITTQNILVPWQTTDTWTPTQAGYQGSGVGTHTGKFSASLVPTSLNTADLVINAANGDKLFGSVFFLSGTQFVTSINGGTGRFQGAIGGFIHTFSSSDPTGTFFTYTSEGVISSVGSFGK